jgi:hypothetical protein
LRDDGSDFDGDELDPWGKIAYRRWEDRRYEVPEQFRPRSHHCTRPDGFLFHEFVIHDAVGICVFCGLAREAKGTSVVALG